MSTKNGKPAPSKKRETGEYTDPQVSVAVIGARTTIVLAILGLIGTLATLIFNYVSSHPIATPITPPINSTATITTTVSTVTPAIETQTVEPTVFATETLDSPAPTSTFISSLPVGMDVQLREDRSSGKSPIFVKFDAKGSFFRDSSGIIYNCQSNKCNYTWYIYLNGDLANTPNRSTDGVLTFKFTKRGAYHIVVTVCRGVDNSECASDGTNFDAS